MDTKILLLCTVSVFLTLPARRLDRRVIVNRFEQHYADPDYIILEVTLKKPDRKMFCSNITLTVLQDTPLNLKMRITLYKYTDNTYRKTGIEFAGNLCEYFSKIEKILYKVQNDPRFDHFIKGCPIKKGTYYAYNVSENVVQYPLPLWTCKVTYLVDNGIKTLLNMTVYFTVVEV